jgi:hypothetical protein
LRRAQIVTKSATPEAGAPADCAANVRAAFARVLELGAAPGGRQRLARAFRLCGALEGDEDVLSLAYWAQASLCAL